MDNREMDENQLVFFDAESRSQPEGFSPVKRADYQEVMKAIDRIGGGGEDGRIRWLLNFVHLDLSNLSTGDWENIKYEFIALQFPLSARSQGADLKDRDKIWIYPSKKDIQLFHSGIKKNINRLIDEGKVVFDFGTMAVTIQPPIEVTRNEDGKLRSVPVPREPWYSIPLTSTTMGLTQYYLADLITPCAHLIRRCPECSKVFLADRKNQSFCSVKHQNYVAGRKYRKTKGLITGKPRGRPRKPPPKKEGES